MDRAFGSGQLIGGLTLIVVGVLFLMNNYLGQPIENWWAIFFFIPAVGAFWAAWAAWRVTRSGVAAAGPFTGGLLLTTVGLIFLLDLPWNRVWPVFLIVGGIGALLPTLLRAARRSSPE